MYSDDLLIDRGIICRSCSAQRLFIARSLRTGAAAATTVTVQHPSLKAWFAGHQLLLYVPFALRLWYWWKCDCCSQACQDPSENICSCCWALFLAFTWNLWAPDYNTGSWVDNMLCIQVIISAIIHLDTVAKQLLASWSHRDQQKCNGIKKKRMWQ